jgi:hypothetical protein
MAHQQEGVEPFGDVHQQGEGPHPQGRQKQAQAGLDEPVLTPPAAATGTGQVRPRP